MSDYTREEILDAARRALEIYPDQSANAVVVGKATLGSAVSHYPIPVGEKKLTVYWSPVVPDDMMVAWNSLTMKANHQHDEAYFVEIRPKPKLVPDPPLDFARDEALYSGFDEKAGF